jgi:two-component system NtrC family sensor kinase
MSDLSGTLLLVDEDSALAGLLRDEATARGYRATCTTSLGDAIAAAGSEPFDAALVHFAWDIEPGLDALRRLKEISPDTEIIVVSGAKASSAGSACERAAFAFVRTPVERARLFTLIDRAIERRRISLHNRRLFWELQTINEIAEGIGRSLELDDVLNGALQRVVRAFDAAAGSIRLRDEATGAYEVRAYVGTTRAQLPWGSSGALPGRPSDRVIATRTSFVIEDLAREVPADLVPNLPVRSVISIPLLAGDELVGTVTVGAVSPYRFDYADERLLAIIAGQILVAVQNARLHEWVRRGKREWERTFDAIADPIAVFDTRGQILRGNRALAALLGRPVTELRHVTCREVGLCGGTCPACAVGQALAADAATSADVSLPNGQIFSVTTFPVAGDHDASVVQVAKNVTEQIRAARQLRQMSGELATTNGQLVAALNQLKATQAQLLQAEKLSAIGQLVAGVAHELNNPLTSVIGYAQLLEEELLDRGVEAPRPLPELAQDLRRIAEESERAARIVRNLLAFARRQTAARVPQDVTELCHRVLSLRSYDLRLNDVELVTEFDADLPDVIADGGQLQQALLNLILNAEQAMRQRPSRRLTVGARFDAEADAVDLFVADTGHGIDHANLSRIFDPFFTTRDVGEGTGLGLSICYGIIRDHGGEIAVASRVDIGTRFTLRLPARAARPHAAPREILVAHADQGERDFFAAALAAWGYGVAAVGRADDALARYRRGGLHAVLLDRALLATTLAEWCSALSGDGGRVPVVLLAAAGSDDAAERFGREHAFAMLAPPYQLHALRSAVRSLDKEKEYV